MMKRFHRYTALLLTLVLILSVTAIAVSAAGRATTSGEESEKMIIYGTGNYSYVAYSALYQDGNRLRPATWIETKDYKNVPANSMGANGRLFDMYGSLVQETRMLYNSASANYQVAVLSNYIYCPNGGYSQGEARLYNGSQFITYTLYKTEPLGARAASLMAQLEDGEYPVNEQGKTYGSAVLANIVGNEPDLISAVGTQGQAGYVKREELRGPDIRTPEEAAAYMQTLPETCMIPLYDCQGEVIGKFEVGIPMDVSGCTLEEAKAMAAAGTANPDAQPVEQTCLVNGDFPKNSLGETYGNGLMMNQVGRAPDLLAAIGTNGQRGYIRRTDEHPDGLDTPEQVLAWQESLPADIMDIPLRDFEGNVIGTFQIDCRPVSEAEIAELRAIPTLPVQK